MQFSIAQVISSTQKGVDALQKEVRIAASAKKLMYLQRRKKSQVFRNEIISSCKWLKTKQLASF